MEKMATDTSSSRRAVLLGAASAMVVPVKGLLAAPDPFLNISRLPDLVVAYAETGRVGLQKNGSRWQHGDIDLATQPGDHELQLKLHAPASNLLRLHFRWNLKVPPALQFLGDHWERSYGDLSWRTMDPDRILPWYMVGFDGHSTFACGVKTGPAAFCFWQVDPAGVSLFLDLRNGGRGVVPGDREIELATVVWSWYPQTQPFAAVRQFCRLMSEHPRLPASPVYGGNNWYYAYGKSSAQAIREDSERIASLSPSSSNRPFMVIDDGWTPNATAGPWSQGNHLFPDMARLASDMKALRVRPGLWIRPLFTKLDVPEGWRLNSPNAAKEFAARKTYTLDPTVRDAASSITADLQTAVAWGYEMIKHDFSTYDLLGRWGFRMGAELTDSGWSFADRSLTNAEIIRNLYKQIRQAVGDTLVLGCNTVGHLSAGLFELSRTGDDTSGRDWNRTRKMGVNTLAFRAAQHGTFFALDADCVGLTNQIPWAMNRQWLDLLAHSGTPLFVSAAPDALGPEQRAAVKQAFAMAATPQPLIEPTDWLTNTQPEHWSAHGTAVAYDWFGNEGAIVTS